MNRKQRKPKTYLAAGLLFGLAPLVAGCGLDPKLSNTHFNTQAQVQPNSSSYRLQSLRWQTTGSGDIIFEISPIPGSSDFSISVTEYQLHARYRALQLSTTNGGPVYDFVQQLFQGNLRAAAGQACQGYCGSTWSQVTTRDSSGQITDFPAPTVAGNPTPNPFDALYQFVISQLK